MDIQKLLKQAQKMQGDIKKTEAELNEKEYAGSASNGAVRIILKGSYEVVSMSIEDDLVDKENKEMLIDLVQIAMNDAMRKVKEDRDKLMGSLTGGVSFPGM
ncbi:MAG: YbaB/EbfC family nucleoid-associated protein [Anaerorhabdus sp.]